MNTGIPVIDELLKGPLHWDATEFGLVLAVVIPTIAWIVRPLREAVRGWIAGLLRPPATFGDFTLPSRHIERRRGEISPIVHIAKSGKRVVLHGPGGRGKSTLARLYVDRRRKLCRGVCWIDAGHDDGLRRAMVWLAKTLDPKLVAETDPDVLCARARELIGRTGGRWILVFDNAEGEADLRPWLPEPRRGLEVLITSRTSDWPDADYTPRLVGALDVSTERSPGVELLWQAAGENAARPDGRAGAHSLARALDGLPLALVCAGGWLRDTATTRFGEYEDRLAELIKVRPESVADYEDSVFAAVCLSLDRLSDEAKLLMKLFAWLAPDDLWPGLVTDMPKSAVPNPQEFWDDIPDELMTLARNSQTVDQAFAELVRRSLLERFEREVADGEDDPQSRHGYRLHRLTQAVQRDLLGGGAIRPPGHPHPPRHPRASGDLPERIAEDPRLRGDDEVRGRVAAEASTDATPGSVPALSRDPETLRAAPAALHAEDRGPGSSPGPSSDGTDAVPAPSRDPEALRAEPAALHAEGRGPGSGPGPSQSGEGAPWPAIAAAVVAAGYPFDSDFRENWRRCGRLGPHVAALAGAPPATAAMEYLLNQASGYLHAQRLDDQALAYSQESLRLTNARLGPAHEEVATACNNLALRLWRLGRMPEAEALAARAVEISEKGGIPSEESYAGRLSTHGLMAEMVGRGLSGPARTEKLTLAARRHMDALAICLLLPGRDARTLGTRLNNLAELRSFQGRWGAALRLHGRALALWRQALPAGDPDLATSLCNLGSRLLQSGRAAEGWRGEGVLDLLAAALEIREDAFDRPDHPDRVNAAGWLATAHWALAALDGPRTGTIVPDPARAAALCAAYDLDPEPRKERAALYADRARLHRSGQPVPPMPGQGPE